MTAHLKRLGYSQAIPEVAFSLDSIALVPGKLSQVVVGDRHPIDIAHLLTEFQAALGLTQMNKLDRVITARRQHAAYYDALLSGTPLQTPIVSNHGTSVYQSYVVLLPEQRTAHRQSLIKQLKARGIETTIGT